MKVTSNQEVKLLEEKVKTMNGELLELTKHLETA